MITIRSSTWNIITQILSPLLLVLVGLTLKYGRPGWLSPLIWIGAGILLGVSGFYLLPVSVRVKSNGFTRIFVLRREHIPWSEVQEVKRTKTGLSLKAMRKTSPSKDVAPMDQGRRWGSAGLAVVSSSGREKVITETLETQEQFERIRDLVGTYAPDVEWNAAAPLAYHAREGDS